MLVPLLPPCQHFCQQPAAIRALCIACTVLNAYASCILQVNVAETETEDQAVKRYMRAVLQSGVINKVCVC